MSDFKNGYCRRTNIVKEEKGDLVTDPTVFWLCGGTILSAVECTWVNDVRQMEIHTAEPLVPESSAFEVEMGTEKLKGHKSSGIDQITA